VASRLRLGVALLLDPPVADEINGLRRALGDRSLDRIAPHVTLVPPVNVRVGDVPAALAVLRRAAAVTGAPIRLTLGPPGSFLPANPVVHLPVGGELEALARLRDLVFDGPFRRTLRWPWVPHVTLADDADPDSIDPVLAVMSSYTATFDVERIVVLEERHGPEGRRWEPFADADLVPAVMVGRGGLDLGLVRGRRFDPAAADLAVAAGHTLPPAGAGPVLTGLVDGVLVGVAAAWRTDGGGRILVAVGEGHRRSGLGRQLLAHTEDAVRVEGWDCPTLRASGPAGFYAACSRWSVAVPGWGPDGAGGDGDDCAGRRQA
jgi:2'-5' RNA ligase